MFERMHEAPYTIELTDETMKLDAALFYQETWADPNYTMSDWDDESVWTWGTKGMVNFGMTSLASLTGGLTEDKPTNDVCSDASTTFTGGVAENEPINEGCSAFSSMHSLERVPTDEVTNGGLFIMVGSDTLELSSAENGGLLNHNQQHHRANHQLKTQLKKP
ncbi:hypothetical protein CH63R_02796 [Colletotrichum higginsianum IMI 349063]|uniref:Uncharacterized protein n=2 Tax=Colletotrichum higginsianum TaxID=80884 RepID=A0A1B7YPU8_COLHI|nr:hypothetical protein CH63R_02796 [Colletotrichum higginsianum IMI 349063]OBR14070.1 hypothetical protein CH63R_02796 [Colletotrichum higginsianum IMI 349063]GJC95270.1 hypothetical protein ColKHC_04096 [Colletotrichum higginsianum]